MSSFVPRATAPTLSEPDPAKHVNYTLGMVLGVDDFTQEFAYLSGRDQWTARDVLGYGTVSGLRVTIEMEDGRPQVLVTPGAAINPRGRLIRVSPSQCADLRLWLSAHGQEVSDSIGVVLSNQALLRLYVVLGYRECLTDLVPIPGEPCRSQDETMAPSRIADDFRLELRLTPPDQTEEDALRDFVDWLGQVQITDEPGSFSTLQELEDAIRNASHIYSSPISSPLDYMYGSPPSGLRIHPSMAFEYLRAVSRIWVTELRPGWQARRHDAALAFGVQTDDEESVLLAEVSFAVTRPGITSAWEIKDPDKIEVHEERRPYLLHLRMLQEIILNGRRGAGGSETEGSAIGPSFTVVAETNYGQLPRAGTRFDYARADHTHGTPPPPVLVGDANGPVGNTRVTGIAGVPVDASPPADNQVLAFDSKLGKWKPSAPLGPPLASISADAVTHPHALPAYRIVAAGLVSSTTAAGRTYNNLRVTKTPTAAGILTLTFDGYKKPQPDKDDPAFQYVVKALLAVAPDSKLTGPSVVFTGFNDADFTLLVNDGGKPVAVDVLGSLQLMIEVSQFDLSVAKSAKEAKEKDTKEKEKEKEVTKETKEAKEQKEQKEQKENEKLAKEKDKDKDTKETKDTKDSKEGKETKEKEKEKEVEKLKDVKELEKLDDKITKETKETKEKDAEKLTDKIKDTKEKEKEAEKLSDKVKDTKEKEKEKEKDTKETKDTKDAKEKDTKETKDTKDAKEKDTKETKDTKDSKEKDTKETREKVDDKVSLKETTALKEIENFRDNIPQPGPNVTAGAADANLSASAPGTADDGADELFFEGRAFIRGEERPAVGRKALELADETVEKPDAKSVEKSVEKSPESSDHPGAVN